MNTVPNPHFLAPNISVNKLSPIWIISSGLSLKSSNIILNIEKDGFDTKSSFDKYNLSNLSKIPTSFRYFLYIFGDVIPVFDVKHNEYLFFSEFKIFIAPGKIEGGCFKKLLSRALRISFSNNFLSFFISRKFNNSLILISVFLSKPELWSCEQFLLINDRDSKIFSSLIFWPYLSNRNLRLLILNLFNYIVKKGHNVIGLD